MSEIGPCNCGCGVNTFSTREADADLKRYLRQGPDGTTRSLLAAIKAEGVQGASLLDVGGGIGVITLELLGSGLGSAQAVDASEPYLAVARAEAQRRGFGDRTSHVLGSLEEVEARVQPADVVTLDRVVCCDPNLPALLGAVTGRARRMIGLVYPRVTWWNRIAARAIAGWGWLTRDPTRWHLHDEAQLDDLLRAAGFERREIDRTLLWQVVLYVRSTPLAPTAPSTGAAG